MAWYRAAKVSATRPLSEGPVRPAGGFRTSPVERRLNQYRGSREARFPSAAATACAVAVVRDPRGRGPGVRGRRAGVRPRRRLVLGGGPALVDSVRPAGGRPARRLPHRAGALETGARRAGCRATPGRTPGAVSRFP